MLQDSKDIYYLSNEELDRNDYTLNVQNGILDLSEDEPKFMELTRICYYPKSAMHNMNHRQNAKDGKDF